MTSTPEPVSAPEMLTGDTLAARVVQALRGQESANNAFESAGVQLCRLVVQLESPGEPGGTGTGEQHAEVFRRLLDFLHAAHGLMAQSAELTALCGAPVPAVAGPLASFMSEIRTCMTHRTVPRMVMVHHAPPAPRLRALHMHMGDMLSWPHWSPPARSFLHQHQPELPLATAIHDYLQQVRMFQQRTVRHFRQVFSEILAAAPPQPVMIRLA